MSFSTNKSNRPTLKKVKPLETVLQSNNQKLLIKNSLIERLKKRNTSKASNKSNRSSFSKETPNNKNVSKLPVKNALVGTKLSHQGDDRILHLTLNGAKHNK